MFSFPALNRSLVWYIIITMTAISFTWSERLSAWGIVLLIVHWLLDKRLIQKMKRIEISWPMFFSIAFFCWHFVALLWSNDPDQAWPSIEVKLSFLLLPILFSSEQYLNTRRVFQLMFLFSISCCLSFLYSLGYDYAHYHHLGLPVMLNRMNISEGIMHPGYYSNYFAFALVWGCYLFVTRQLQSKKMKLLIIAFMIIQSIALLLLISKTAILFVAILGIAIIWHLLSIVPSVTFRIGLFIMTLAAMLIIGLNIPTIAYRIDEAKRDRAVISTDISIKNSTGSRIVAWQQEWQLITQKPLQGYGTGSANSVLRNKLESKGYHRLAAEQMHTHHQLLHTWLDLGLAGIVLLLAWLVSSCIEFIKTSNHLGIWLCVLILLNILTDDMLEVQAGAVFFLFFLNLPMAHDEKLSSAS
jgi:O-antigen ligase